MPHGLGNKRHAKNVKKCFFLGGRCLPESVQEGRTHGENRGEREK